MNAFQISICRWMSTTLVVFGILGRSESFTLTRKPANPTVVVEGVNSTQVELVWDFTATSNYIAIISRQRIGDLEATPIAARTQSTGFVLEDPSFSTKYEPSLNATLVIKNVNRTDEYRYSLRVLTTLGSQRLADVVTVNFLYGFRDLPRQFGQLLTSKECSRCSILPVGLGGSTLIKNL
ncbi:uncharacterized protein LOC144662845 [Oculina patagonica]